MLFKGLEAAPPDAILGLTEAFRADENPQKMNLGVGVYKDDSGQTPVLDCVREAEARLQQAGNSKTYMPIDGSPVYQQCVRALLFGDQHEWVDGKGPARTAQTPGGTGALRVGAELLRKFAAGAKIWVSNPTWANHRGIFEAAGFEVVTYPYYDEANKCVDFDAMSETLAQVGEQDVVLLHVCCHNPTGMDLSEQQWASVVDIAKQQGWLPFLDFAYQGFGTGLESDRFAVEAMAQGGIPFFVASSFSKNFGLYCERTGALTIVGDDAETAAAMQSHLKKTIRVVYSNPPAHGARIVETIMADDGLRGQWIGELAIMRERIIKLRSALVEKLHARGVDRDLSYIEKQRGMFSYSGLTKEQVKFLREQKGIYIVGAGRINVAGIRHENLDYLCDSIAEALRVK